ncbi:MAG: hypothetical protein R6X21_05990 [Candidatus Aminicenantes bacterium]
MDILTAVEPGVAPADLLIGLVYVILKILAYGAIGIALVGVVTTCWCCLFECRRCRGSSGDLRA